MYPSSIYSSETENEVEINMPEWKKLLIMKKRSGFCLGIDENTRRNVEIDALRNGSNDIICNKSTKTCASSRVTEMSPLKTVTIGSINVELRSVPTSLPANISGSENSEDFQYGPGIVDRLRAKFLNIGIKQFYKPVVRRFSSLENLPGSQKINTRNIRQNYVKKAVSMETLICTTPECLVSRRPNVRVIGGVKARILSRGITPTDENEKPKEISSKFFHPVPARRWEFNNTVPNSTINEDELPKPDTVKHVKKLFESPSPPLSVSEKHTRFRKIQSPTAPHFNCAIKSTAIKVSQDKAKPLCAKESPNVNSFLETEEDEINDLADNSILLAGDNLSANKSHDTIEGNSELSEMRYEEGVLASNENSSIHKHLELIRSEKNSGSAELDELDSSPTLPTHSLTSSGGEVKKGASSWHNHPQSTNSIIFDFRGREDVEPHISINPTPFSCKPAKISKRSGSPPRTASEEEDYFDDWDVGADLPAVSGIIFAGENVKVGRGALLEKRNKKLSIQFDDKAISTFEYPSETASPKEEIAIGSPANCRLGLSNYTPHFLSNNKEYELGVSQSNHRPVAISFENNEDVPLLDVIIPTDSNDTVGWSATETADILF